MKPSEVLIVGAGIAGSVLSRGFMERGVSVTIMDDGHRSSSSLAAAGMYNPLMLKRLRKAWSSDVFLKDMAPFYRSWQEDLQTVFLHETGLQRRMDSVEERNDWETKRSAPLFKEHLGEVTEVEQVTAPFDAGQGLIDVSTAGWVDVKQMLASHRQFMVSHEQWIEAEFDESKLISDGQQLVYEGHSYSYIILCRGYKERSPYFPILPFSPAKGQTMTLSVPGLNMKEPLHFGLFVIPLGGDHYRIGSTYSWSNFDQELEAGKRAELLKRFEARCTLPYTIVEERAGVRPATKDRRPIMGRSPLEERMILFNGLGSRGVMMAPWLAERLLDHLIDDRPIPREIDLNRFNDSNAQGAV